MFKKYKYHTREVTKSKQVQQRTSSESESESESELSLDSLFFLTGLAVVSWKYIENVSITL